MITLNPIHFILIVYKILRYILITVLSLGSQKQARPIYKYYSNLVKMLVKELYGTWLFFKHFICLNYYE